MSFKPILLTVGLLHFLSFQTFGQEITTSPLPIEGLKGTIGIEAGKYEFYDPTKIQGKILDEVFKRSEKDREYYLNYIREMNEGLRELVLIVHGEKESLSQVSDDSWNGANAMDHLEFLKITRRFRTAKLTLENRMQGLTSLAEGAFPSRTELKNEEEMQQVSEIPPYGKLNFSDITTFYKKQMESLETTAKNLPYKIKYKDNTIHEIQPNSGDGLVLRASYAVYSDEEYNKLEDQLKLWRLPDMIQKQKFDAFTTYVRRRLQEFINTYGKELRYWSRGPEHMENMVRVAMDISDVFWARSYIRAAYGIPLGAIYAQYKPRWFNIERFLTKTENIVEFQEQVAWRDEELDHLQRNYLAALRIAEDRSGRLTEKGQAEYTQEMANLDKRAFEADDDLSVKILEGDATLLGQLNSFGTFIRGKRPLAEVYHMMLRLLAADLYDEVRLRQGGQQEMVTRYRTRYATATVDKEIRTHYLKLRKMHFPSPEERKNGGPVSTNVMVGTGSLAAHIRDVQGAIRSKQRDLNRASDLELLLENAILIGKNGADKNQMDTINDMLEGSKVEE